MAEYLIQEETLTGIADKIRILSGTEDAMTTAQMDSSLGDANTEVDSQADLLAQAVAALEGKAAGGGGSVETCTIVIDTDGVILLATIRATILENGKIQPYYYVRARDGDITMPYTIENVICGSLFSADFVNGSIFSYKITGEVINKTYTSRNLVIAPMVAGSTVTIYGYDSD